MLSQQKVIRIGTINNHKSVMLGFRPNIEDGGWYYCNNRGMMNGVPYIMYDAGYYQMVCMNRVISLKMTMMLMLLNTYLNDFILDG